MAQVAQEQSPLADGIRMVMSQVESWLKSEGLNRVETQGLAFDPTIHEAIKQVETSDVPAGHIVQEVRRGYRWADRLLRPAAVVVNKKPDTNPGHDQGVSE
jgi:molecular chaperone GrpE